MWKIQRLVFALLAPPLPLGPPSTRMVSSAVLGFPVPFPALSRRLSCSPIVGYFLFGAVGVCGEGRHFPPHPLGPAVFTLLTPRALLQ